MQIPRWDKNSEKIEFESQAKVDTRVVGESTLISDNIFVCLYFGSALLTQLKLSQKNYVALFTPANIVS